MRFQTRSCCASVLAWIASASALAAQNELELLDLAGRADPAAVAVDLERGVLFSAEGAVVRELDFAAWLDGKDALRAEVVTDTATVALCPAGDRLFVAGGSQGLGRVDLSDPERPFTTVHDDGRRVCTDVVPWGERIVAAFGARDDSRLVVLGEPDLQLLAEVDLGDGTAWAVAASGSAVYVAMGTGGLLRVRDAADGFVVEPGPRGATRFPPPEGFQLEAGMIRDLAIADGWLFAAADAGLVRLDLGEDWEPEMPIEVEAFRSAGLPSYARRVAVGPGRLLVGTNAGPSELLDGAPYSAFGRMGRGLLLGDVDPEAYVRGDEQHLLVYRREAGELIRELDRLPGGGWRGLEAAGDLSVEQHLRLGLTVRDLAAPDAPVLRSVAPTGFAAAHLEFSIARPNRVLFGFDSAGAVFDGFLQVQNGRFEPVSVSGANRKHLGVFPSKPWGGADGNTEWLVDSDGLNLRLHRLRHDDGIEQTVWNLAQPKPPDGSRGHSYFHACRDGDLLLVARCGTRYGLVGYSLAALVEAAEAAAPGTTLGVTAHFQAPTHPVQRPTATNGSHRAMKLSIGELPDGRRIAALGAGFDTAEDHALVQLFELSADSSKAPRPLGIARGERPGGNAVVAEWIRRGKSTFVVVADAGFGVQCFDVSDPRRPTAAARWEVPRDPFDGEPDTVLDVEVRGDRAYVACSRHGVVVLDLTDPAGEDLPVLATDDTPGLAYGVATAELGDQTVLVVGDHQGGVRLYALPPSSE